MVFSAFKFPELMSDMNEETFAPVEPTVPVSLVSDWTGVAGVVGVVFPSALVDAGGGFGSGRPGMFPASGLGTSVALAGADSGIYLYLYFTEEFQSRQSNFFL